MRRIGPTDGGGTVGAVMEIRVIFTSNEWKSRVRSVLERIADENYQRQAWFNQHAEVSSPDELINQLLGDFRFEDFVNARDIGLSHGQRDAARKCLELLKSFCAQTPEHLDPSKIIDDARWIKIRKAAKEVLRVLEKGD